MQNATFKFLSADSQHFGTASFKKMSKSELNKRHEIKTTQIKAGVK